MTIKSIIVGGVLSGTGLRDAIEGGYIDPEDAGVSGDIQRKLKNWLGRYEDAHYHQFDDDECNHKLDDEGISIARMLKGELPNVSVTYFSSAYLRETLI